LDNFLPAAKLADCSIPPPLLRKFKVKNCVRLGGALGPVGYVVNTTKRCVQIVQDEDVFKAGANIKFGRNMGTVHVCPYVGEITGELRGKLVAAHWVAAVI
jgi:hypothetical protein